MGEHRGAGGAVERSYVYDATNQLRALTERTRLGVLTARYAYDALGRRVSKTVERRPLTAANDGAADARVVASVETREFLWLGNVLLAEGPAGSVLESVYLHEPGSFQPLALVRGGTVRHYHLDHLGTPQEVTNDTGEIVWRARLKAWGGVARTLNTAIAQPIRFQGQYHDAESGLYYNRYRYYAPDEGCYVQQDPIGLAGGINTAAYVAAPTGWVDPFGLAGCGANVEGERSPSTKTTPYVIRIDPKTGRGPMAIDTSSFKGKATMNGGVRKSQQVWKAWKDAYPETFSDTNVDQINVGQSPVVDDTWANRSRSTPTTLVKRSCIII